MGGKCWQVNGQRLELSWVAYLCWLERAAIDGQMTSLATVVAGGLRGVLGRPLATQVPHAVACVAAHQSQICLVVVLCASTFSPTSQQPHSSLLPMLVSQCDCCTGLTERAYKLHGLTGLT